MPLSATLRSLFEPVGQRHQLKAEIGVEAASIDRRGQSSHVRAAQLNFDTSGLPLRP